MLYPIYGKLGNPLASQRTRFFFHLFAPTSGGIHGTCWNPPKRRRHSPGPIAQRRLPEESSVSMGGFMWGNRWEHDLAKYCVLFAQTVSLSLSLSLFFSWWGTAHPEMAFWLHIPATSWRIQSAMAVAQNRLASYMENGQPMTYPPGVAGVYPEFGFSSFSHHHHGAQPRIKSDTYSFLTSRTRMYVTHMWLLAGEMVIKPTTNTNSWQVLYAIVRVQSWYPSIQKFTHTQRPIPIQHLMFVYQILGGSEGTGRNLWREHHTCRWLGFAWTWHPTPTSAARTSNYSTVVNPRAINHPKLAHWSNFGVRKTSA